MNKDLVRLVVDLDDEQLVQMVNDQLIEVDEFGVAHVTSKGKAVLFGWYFRQGGDSE